MPLIEYPSRFYIDDNITLHTDRSKDNIFGYIGDNNWKSKHSVIMPKKIIYN